MDDLRVDLCIGKCVMGRLVNEQGMLRERMKAAQQGWPMDIRREGGGRGRPRFRWLDCTKKAGVEYNCTWTGEYWS